MINKEEKVSWILDIHVRSWYFGQDSNKKLKELTIVIYGNGDSLQQEVYKNLCMMGVGKIIIEIPPSMNKYFKTDLNLDCNVIFDTVYDNFVQDSNKKSSFDVFIICDFQYLWNNISNISNSKKKYGL